MMKKRTSSLLFPLNPHVTRPASTFAERLCLVRKIISGHMKLKRKRQQVRKLYDATWREDSKPFVQVMRELHQWVSSGRAFPVRILINYYFQFRLQYEGTQSVEYIFEYEWLKYARVLLEYAGNECTILNNKDSAWHAFVRQGLSVPRRFGVLRKEKEELLIGDREGGVIPLNRFLLDNCPRIFVKPSDGMKGNGSFLVEGIDQERCRVNGNAMRYDEFSRLIVHPLLVEEAVLQHPDIACLHPDSLNTLRLITMRGIDGQSRYVAGMLRMGTGKMFLDNLSQGGLAVGIKPTGILKKWGYTEDPLKKEVFSHPDTEVVFEGRRIPFWQECLDLVCRAHEGFPCTHSVGWDVAVTPSGPVIIEANCSYGMLEIQLIDHGLREAFETMLLPAALTLMKEDRK